MISNKTKTHEIIRDLTCYKNGSFMYESYFLNDLYHREDGPAYTIYSPSGEIIRETYFLHGKPLTKKDFDIYMFNKTFDEEVNEVLSE